MITPDAASLPVGTGTASSQVVGTLVHRMLERAGTDAADEPDALAAAARRLLRPEEAGAPDEAAALVARAVELYRGIRRQPDVARLYAGGERFHEVPFTLTVDGRPVRGAIDCLVRDGGRVTILEFKTGRRRPAHDAQVALYRRAAESLFPGLEVEARVVYADGPA